MAVQLASYLKKKNEALGKGKKTGKLGRKTFI